MVVSTRIVLSLLGVLGAIQAGLSSDFLNRYSASYAYPAFGVIVFLAFAVGWMIGGLVGQGLVRGFKRVERAAQTRSAGELTVAAIGLLLGLLVSALLWFPVHALPYIGNWVILPLFLVVGYLFAYVAAKKHRGILRLVGVHQLVDPSMPGSSIAGVETLVDTSAIIDGRIADIVRTGFLRGELVVPEFVLARAPAGRRLRRSAEAGARPARARGRAGPASEVTVATPEVDFPELADVDAKLLKLAKQQGLRILTTDYNLNRLARIQDVVVLNVNELANALKPAVLPGERLEIRLIREGKEADQGVGYLDDGTMVVVEGGRRRVGDTVDVQVTSCSSRPQGR